MSKKVSLIIVQIQNWGAETDINQSIAQFAGIQGNECTSSK